MDDHNFDQKTAQEWISVVEGSASLREGDIYPLLKAWVDLVSPRELLEIGCGQGACSDRFDWVGRKYTGLDPSLFLVERAKQLYLAENRRFLVGNAYELPLSSGAYDAVFSVAVWHLLSNLPKAAKEVARVLGDQGHFLIVTANPDSYSDWKALYTVGKSEGRRFEGEVRRLDQTVSHDVLFFPTLNEIMDSLHSAGLQVQATEAIRFSNKSPGAQGLFLVIRGQKSPRSARRG